MPAPPRKEVLLAQLLTLHLDLAIKRYKGTTEMSKFLQLADDIESDFKDLDNDADELNSRRLVLKERKRVIFNDHHTAYDRVEAGLKRMDEVLHAMGGSNSDKMTAAEKAALAAKVADAEKKVAEVTGTAAETAKLGEDSDVTSEASFPTGTGNSGAKVG